MLATAQPHDLRIKTSQMALSNWNADDKSVATFAAPQHNGKDTVFSLFIIRRPSEASHVFGTETSRMRRCTCEDGETWRMGSAMASATH